MHPRLIPGNADVALKGFEDVVSAKYTVKGVIQQVCVPVADVLRAPGGSLDRQLLLGAEFEVIDAGPYSFGRCVRDGYVGHISSDQLGKQQTCTHKICARSSHVYPAPDMKTRPMLSLPFGARLTAVGREGDFLALLGGGFVPQQHVEPATAVAPDFVTVFERFTGTPYLWGGDSIWGIDCSGALQTALHEAGQPCPRDTDMQIADLGLPIVDPENLLRGDIIFWQGHVGVMADSVTLLHANAFHMAVAAEPLAGAIPRVAANGGGDVIAYRRLQSVT